MTQGNYTPYSLINDIKTKMNLIERINSTSTNRVYNQFDISVDTFTQMIKFTRFKEDTLIQPFRIKEITLNGETRFKLVINHPSNSVNVGDEITITGAKKTQGIFSIVLNQTHIVFEVNNSYDSYSVILPFLNLSTLSTDTGGGNSVVIKSLSQFRFLFNYSDTIGTILGFRDVGEDFAITNFSSIITNQDNYAIEGNFNLNSIGNTKNNTTFLNFSGEDLYFLMYLNDYESITTNNEQLPAFAKIQLSSNPGDVIFNTHINYPVVFENPLSQLNELAIKFTYADGSQVNFGNTEHSFTIKITELRSITDNMFVNSKDVKMYPLEDKPVDKSINV